MKVRKTAVQQNVLLNMDWYNKKEIKEMMENHEIFFVTEKTYEISYDFDSYDNEPCRIFTNNMKEIKVICDTGYYINVIISNEGKQYYITL